MYLILRSPLGHDLRRIEGSYEYQVCVLAHLTPFRGCSKRKKPPGTGETIHQPTTRTVLPLPRGPLSFVSAIREAGPGPLPKPVLTAL